MKKNVGKIDSYLRYLLGFILVILAYTISWWLLIPAVILIVTGYRKICHVYTLCGANTCKNNN